MSIFPKGDTRGASVLAAVAFAALFGLISMVILNLPSTTDYITPVAQTAAATDPLEAKLPSLPATQPPSVESMNSSGTKIEDQCNPGEVHSISETSGEPTQKKIKCYIPDPGTELGSNAGQLIKNTSLSPAEQKVCTDSGASPLKCTTRYCPLPAYAKTPGECKVIQCKAGDVTCAKKALDGYTQSANSAQALGVVPPPNSEVGVSSPTKGYSPGDLKLSEQGEYALKTDKAITEIDQKLNGTTPCLSSVVESGGDCNPQYQDLSMKKMELQKGFDENQAKALAANQSTVTVEGCDLACQAGLGKPDKNDVTGSTGGVVPQNGSDPCAGLLVKNGLNCVSPKPDPTNVNSTGAFVGPCPNGPAGPDGCPQARPPGVVPPPTGGPPPGYVPSGSPAGSPGGIGGGMSNGVFYMLGSMLGNLMKGSGAGGSTGTGTGQSTSCATNQDQYQQQQQQYNQQIQQYNYQLQQQQYQQQQQMYGGGGYSPYGYQNTQYIGGNSMMGQPLSPPPMQPPPPCYSNQNPQQCSYSPQQPNYDSCTGGTWKSTTSGNGCISGWQCVPGTGQSGGTGAANGPAASISCEPKLADVGMTLAISFSCANSTTSSGGGFNTGGALSGSATTTIHTPPAGLNTATYTLTCNSAGTTAGAQCSVQIGKPSISFVASPATVHVGESSTIGWITTGMQSCIVSSPDLPNFTSQNAGYSNPNGVATAASLTTTAHFSLQCTTDGGGSIVASTMVTVI